MAETEQEKAPVSADEDTDEESEVLDESPCGRWQKRREEVEQRDVPGIDHAFLAMDTEEGMEVVWNEVQFSENRNFKAQEEKIRQGFDNLIQLDHPNIVKFHKYWMETSHDKSRVIFITEYMSSGSLKQFLKKTKKNTKTVQLKQWKRWCTQILSALSYLHSCTPPIIHGNLSCETIFIQHNGLIKIGSVAPDAMHQVKTCRGEDLRNMHCVAPEYVDSGNLSTAVDIYAFGMCALEMAAPGMLCNGEASAFITPDAVESALQSIENIQQRDFISKCLEKDKNLRPTARDLLFHSVIFEVHSLQLLAAHALVDNASMLPGNLPDEAHLPKMEPNKVIAEVRFSKDAEPVQWKFSQVPALELEKFLEDVRNGIYPFPVFSMPRAPKARSRAITPELAESVKSETPDPLDVETRMVTNISGHIQHQEEQPVYQLNLLLRMDDKMNRQLQCDIAQDDTATGLADELVHYGFINESDRDKIASFIEEKIGSLQYNTEVSATQIPIA
ncbi:hypothetical protein ACJMK2_040508 [Sinanodonta woodiana]|uniref:Nuclear receptor-binding protein homolog n=1 Tax=Sinanodonta woodiana TaxID=1069815 RepID=A0ABD3W244_SINWO